MVQSFKNIITRLLIIFKYPFCGNIFHTGTKVMIPHPKEVEIDIKQGIFRMGPQRSHTHFERIGVN